MGSPTQWREGFKNSYQPYILNLFDYKSGNSGKFGKIESGWKTWSPDNPDPEFRKIWIRNSGKFWLQFFLKLNFKGGLWNNFCWYDQPFSRYTPKRANCDCLKIDPKPTISKIWKSFYCSIIKALHRPFGVAKDNKSKPLNNIHYLLYFHIFHYL